MLELIYASTNYTQPIAQPIAQTNPIIDREAIGISQILEALINVRSMLQAIIVEQGNNPIPEIVTQMVARQQEIVEILAQIQARQAGGDRQIETLQNEVARTQIGAAEPLDTLIRTTSELSRILNEINEQTLPNAFYTLRVDIARLHDAIARAVPLK